LGNESFPRDGCPHLFSSSITQAQVLFVFLKSTQFIFEMGKLHLNFTQNNRVVPTPLKNSNVNHICHAITPDFEGKSFPHMKRNGICC